VASTGRFKFPQRIGSYRIKGLIGQGGMGAVLEARDERAADRPVAIKLLLQGRDADRATRQRFLREGAMLAKVNHRNVVRVHEAGEHEGLPYLVLELVEGESLQDKLTRGGPLPAQEVARVGAEIADALQAAHDLGVLHRDLKPDNILLEASGRPLLTDFGLAKDLDRLGETQRLTQTSVYMGTPGYWSPEQASGKPGRITRASDVFGLGSTLHGLLSGGPPFEAETFLALVVRTLEEPPNPLPPHVPVGLRVVIHKCMEKDPDARYASASDLAEDLRRVAAGEAPLHAELPPAPTPRRVIAGLVVAIAVVLAIPLFYVGGRGPSQASPSAAPSVSSSPSPSAAPPHWTRYREGLESGDLERGSRSLAAAYQSKNAEARALLEERWVEVRLSAPRGPQVRLEFIDQDPPLLALLGVQYAVFWDLRAIREAPQRVLIPTPGLPVLATAAPRLAYLQGSEVVVHEAGSPGRMIWKRPLLLGEYDVLAISPKGTRIAYTGGGRIYVEDVIRKWEPVNLPTGVRPELVFLDEDRLCVLAGNVDPTQPGWAGKVDLSQRPLRVEVSPFPDAGPAGNPSWLLGATGGWAFSMARAEDAFLAVPPQGRPFGFDYDVGEDDREAPPFTFGASSTSPLLPPLLLALRKPYREGVPLEVLSLEDGRVRSLLRRVVKSGSDVLAISRDQTLVATGDGVEGAVYVYLTGGRPALR
jgi:serine/threonine protein kinase